MKILIVGAGAAGITAGHALSEKGIDFEILEASSVHGGRVKKNADFADFPIDLGAEWVHRAIKAKAPTTQALLSGQSPDFKIFSYRPKAVLQYKNGKLRSNGWMKLLFAIVNDGKFVDSTWFDFIDQLVTPEIKKKIHYSSPAIKVQHSSKEIVVTSASGEQFRADKVLITVPIKMLQDDPKKAVGIARIFEKMDKDNSGGIDVEELTNGLSFLGLEMSDVQIRIFHEACDENGDGNISLDEFTSAVSAAQQKRLAAKANSREGKAEAKKAAKALKSSWAKVCSFVCSLPRPTKMMGMWLAFSLVLPMLTRTLRETTTQQQT